MFNFFLISSKWPLPSPITAHDIQVMLQYEDFVGLALGAHV
jgi:hypothetical protein